jgi:hypothetical protein
MEFIPILGRRESLRRQGCEAESRRAIKPKAEQKPANEGLFGDGANQTDLVDLTGRPAATKPVTGAIAKDHFFSITRECHAKDRAML